MSFEIKEFYVKSSDGIHTLSGVVYVPEGEARGLFHVVHGMTEYIGRYHKFMSDMASAGYICFGYDNLGHGATANSRDELGYIAKERGWELLCRDVKVYSDAVRAEYDPEGKLQYCLMGHSMGSFIVRLATERFIRPDKLIIMGTGGPNPAAGAGLMLIGIIKLFKGDRHISRFIDNMAFGSYNDRFKDENDPKAWLTTDKAIRDKYRTDPLCSYRFTVSAMGDLIRVMKYSNRGGWYKALPKDVPMLLVAGENDPVGSYGKGVCKVAKRLADSGIATECKIYPGVRHEILNDVCYSEVLSDIQSFIER